MENEYADYSKHKVLCRFTKKKSPYKVMFVTDDPDEWFIDVVYHKKNGQVHDSSRIIEKDMETWKHWLVSNGWESI